MTKLKKCVGKENMQRLNYLYQIGNHYIKADSPVNNLLAIYYTKLLTSVSKKTVQRIEPNIKRNLCKICKSAFIPGKNCKIRIKKGKICYYCNTCTFSKYYVTQQTNLWFDQAESVKEVLDYSQNKIDVK